MFQNTKDKYLMIGNKTKHNTNNKSNRTNQTYKKVKFKTVPGFQTPQAHTNRLMGLDERLNNCQPGVIDDAVKDQSIYTYMV